MLITLLSATLALQGPPALDPLLGKFPMLNTVGYLRKLPPKETVHLGLMGDVATLSKEVLASGGRVITRTKSVITVIVSAGEGLKLAANPATKQAEHGWPSGAGLPRGATQSLDQPRKAPDSSVPLLDRPFAVASLGLDKLRKSKPELTGKGVLVGIVEMRPADFRHPDLLSNGKTRFVSVWDQFGEGTSPEPFGYGRVTRSAELDKVIADGKGEGYSFGSASDHATASIGAAAGNGAALGRFCGVAPEASLCQVVDIPFPPNTVDAVAFIFAEADRLGVPCVVNISEAALQGQGLPHEGTDLQAVALSELVAEKPGRAIVSSAGNQALTSRHGSVALAPDKPVRYCLRPVGPAAPYIHSLTIPRSGAVSIRIGQGTLSGDRIAPDASSEWIDLSKMEEYAAQRIAFKGKPSFGVNVISQHCGEASRQFLLEIRAKDITSPSGIQIELKGNGTVNTQSHLYLEHVAAPGVDGYVQPDNLRSVCSPASGSMVMAVGGFDDAGSWTSADGKPLKNEKAGAIAFYSQPGGPLGEGYKPWVAAPTSFPAPLAIDSPDSEKGNCLEGRFHWMYGGTSAAGPVLAGVVALWLQAHPTATGREIIDAIKACATGDAQTGTLPNPLWGYGKPDLARLFP